jgi:N-methylhydantoinase A
MIEVSDGAKPTVTDADLLLGRIDPDCFAAGTSPLAREPAEAAFRAQIGRQSGMNALEAAYATVEMVDESMANAARVQASELGRELATHTLLAFGGAAPLHAARLAEKAGDCPCDRSVECRGRLGPGLSARAPGL